MWLRARRARHPNGDRREGPRGWSAFQESGWSAFQESGWSAFQEREGLSCEVEALTSVGWWNKKIIVTGHHISTLASLPLPLLLLLPPPPLAQVRSAPQGRRGLRETERRRPHHRVQLTGAIGRPVHRRRLVATRQARRRGRGHGPDGRRDKYPQRAVGRLRSRSARSLRASFNDRRDDGSARRRHLPDNPRAAPLGHRGVPFADQLRRRLHGARCAGRAGARHRAATKTSRLTRRYRLPRGRWGRSRRRASQVVAHHLCGYAVFRRMHACHTERRCRTQW